MARRSSLPEPLLKMGNRVFSSGHGPFLFLFAHRPQRGGTSLSRPRDTNQFKPI